MPDFVLATTQDIFDENRQMIVDVVKAANMGLVFADANPECAVSLQWKALPDTKPADMSDEEALQWDLNILDGRIRGIVLHAGERTFIELFQGKPEQLPPRSDYRHICFEVDDIQATAAALREKGVEVGEIGTGTDGSYQAWLADPDGNKIELHQLTEQSRQTKALRELAR